MSNWVTYTWATSTITIGPQSFLAPGTYSILQSGSTYYAVDGFTGATYSSGSNPSTAIQAVINAMTLGGEIVFKRTGYLLTAGLTVPYPITFSGESKEMTYLYTTSDITAFTINAAGVVFRNIKIFSDNNSPTGSAIFFNNTVNGIVQGSTISGFKYGVYSLADNASLYGLTIDGNIIYGQRNGGEGVHIEGSVSYANGGHKVVNNHFSGTAERLTDMGIYMKSQVLFMEIANNHFDDMIYDGIFSDGSIVTNKYLNIHGNDFERIGRDPVSLLGVEHFDISGTVNDQNATYKGRYGVALSSTKYGTVWTTVRNMGDHGLFIWNSQFISVYGTYMSNSQSSPGTFLGVYLGNSANITVSGVVASDDQGSPTQKVGIGEDGTSNWNVITGSSTIGNSVMGILKLGANSQVHTSYNGSSWVS